MIDDDHYDTDTNLGVAVMQKNQTKSREGAGEDVCVSSRSQANCTSVVKARGDK